MTQIRNDLSPIIKSVFHRSTVTGVTVSKGTNMR